MVSMLVLGRIGLALVGCVWTARRYLRAQRAALLPPVLIADPISVRDALFADGYLEAA